MPSPRPSRAAFLVGFRFDVYRERLQTRIHPDVHAHGRGMRRKLGHLRDHHCMLDDNGAASIREGIAQDIEDIDAAINQFLEFVRDASSESATPNANLNDLVAGLAQRYERAGKPLLVQTTNVPPLPLRTLTMQRLISNLIENAFRYGGNEVTLATGSKDATAFAEVLDRGPAFHRNKPSACCNRSCAWTPRAASAAPVWDWRLSIASPKCNAAACSYCHAKAAG